MECRDQLEDSLEGNCIPKFAQSYLCQRAMESKSYISLNATFIMAVDSKTSNSVQHSKSVSDLLDEMKRYLRIEQQ